MKIGKESKSMQLFFSFSFFFFLLVWFCSVREESTEGADYNRAEPYGRFSYPSIGWPNPIRSLVEDGKLRCH